MRLTGPMKQIHLEAKKGNQNAQRVLEKWRKHENIDYRFLLRWGPTIGCALLASVVYFAQKAIGTSDEITILCLLLSAIGTISLCFVFWQHVPRNCDNFNQSFSVVLENMQIEHIETYLSLTQQQAKERYFGHLHTLGMTAAYYLSMQSKPEESQKKTGTTAADDACHNIRKSIYMGEIFGIIPTGIIAEDFIQKSAT